MSDMFRKSTPFVKSALLSVLAFNVGAWQPAGAQTARKVAFGGGNPSASTTPVQGTGAAGQNPRAVSLYNLGLTAFRQGSPESAIIFFKRACDIDPNLADAQYNLAVIYQSQKRFRDAIPRYEEVLRLKPTDPDAHYQIGVILFDMGRFSEARPHFNAIAPNNVHFSDSQRRLSTMNQAQPSSATNYGTTFNAPPVTSAQPNPGPGYQPPHQASTPPAVTSFAYGSSSPSSPPYAPPSRSADNESMPPPAVSSSHGTSAYGSNNPSRNSTQNEYSQPPSYTREISSQPPSYGQQNPGYGQQPQSTYTAPANYGQQPPSSPPQQQLAYQSPQGQPSVPTAAPPPTSGNPVPLLANTTLRVIATGFNAPAGLAFDRAGNLYVANFMTNSVDRIAPDGSRTQFSSGVNLRGPIGLAVDEIGNLYVANYNNGTVARINPAGVSTVIAQNLRKPYYLTLDREGNLYVSQQEDNSIVRISLPRQQASSKPQ
jgi:hypothetical protein